MFIGIYGHPSPPELAPTITSHEVKRTWTTEAIHFASSYAAKSLLLLKALPE